MFRGEAWKSTERETKGKETRKDGDHGSRYEPGSREGRDAAEGSRDGPVVTPRSWDSSDQVVAPLALGMLLVKSTTYLGTE